MSSRHKNRYVQWLVAVSLILPLVLSVGGGTAQAQAPLPLNPLLIPKYVDPLPTFVGNRVDGTQPLTVRMQELQQQVLPASMYAGLPAPFNTGTYVWGYQISDGANTYGPLYPAYTIEAQRGTPTQVTYVNELVNPVLQQYLTVDQTLHWADPLGTTHDNNCMMGLPLDPACQQPYAGPVPAVVHLHGGEVPSAFDGGPDAWFTPGLAQTGPGFVSDTYTYPNTQEGATLWFHDHTLGATRLNVYAGLAGFYFLRDPNPNNGPATPLPGGAEEIEIVIQDRMFDTNGQWLFPNLGINPEHPFWLPEFLGNAIVVNGKTWPYLEVEPRRYLFRFLNGSNARFYSMRLMDPVTMLPGPPIWQVGTDGGLLDTPVMMSFPNELLIAPGERADVIIDFAAITPGTGPNFILYNSARAPYPKGAPVDPNTTGQVMQFRVVKPLSGTDNSYNPAVAVAGSLRPNNPIVRLASGGALGQGVTPAATRQLTLNEVMGAGGPLEVLVNNTKWDGTMSGFTDPALYPNGVSELPRVGATEVWEIINLTADAHPIHLHLVQFQLLNRQAFQTNKYLKAYNAAFAGGAYIPGGGPPLDYMTGSPGILGGNPDATPYLKGKPASPLPNEEGWKDTVIMYPGEVTRIVVRWASQDVLSVGAGTNTFAFDPTTGPGYVWHCHIIDHEDNEMMRPYYVRP